MSAVSTRPASLDLDPLSAGPTSAAICVENLYAGYPGVLALEDVSFTVASGEICALLGANGSGKSTLFNTLLGMSHPRAGRVRLAGGSVVSARKSNTVSYMPQQDLIDPNFPITVEQVVLTGRYGHLGWMRRARAKDRDTVTQALDDVGMLPLRHRGIGELSGGQRKRTLLARSIAQQSPIMLLDEPFAGVDKGSEAVITDVIQQLRQDRGVTVLISTHHLDTVPALADTVILLQRRILDQGPPSQVLTDRRLGEVFSSALRTPRQDFVGQSQHQSDCMREGFTWN